MNDVEKRYFLWIANSAVTSSLDRWCRTHGVDLRAVMKEMHYISFEGLPDLDASRVDDGINLRYRFGRCLDIPDAQIASEIDMTHCSALEVIAAMALRAGEDMFGNPYEREGAQWLFEQMLRNMGVLEKDADVFDICDAVVDRTYASNGKGGPFYIQKCPKDLRRLGLWEQMMLYLDVSYDDFMAKMKAGK